MAWVAALLYYPPFILMNGGPLDYQVRGADWGYWLAGHDGLLALWGMVLVGLIAVYDWATMALGRSEEHTSELQSLMRISYAVFCLKHTSIPSHQPSSAPHPMYHIITSPPVHLCHHLTSQTSLPYSTS